MRTISDTIEKFLLDNFSNEELELSRNELADFFGCVPSQINYVLSTRFTLDKGYIVDSQRGGGGYVKIKKINIDDKFKDIIFERIGNNIDYNSACCILDNLCRNGKISEEQKVCITIAIEPKALKTPFLIENDLRAKILKNILYKIYN